MDQPVIFVVADPVQKYDEGFARGRGDFTNDVEWLAPDTPPSEMGDTATVASGVCEEQEMKRDLSQYSHHDIIAVFAYRGGGEMTLVWEADGPGEAHQLTRRGGA